MKLLTEILDLYKKEITSYASGKKAIPIAYYCGQHTTGYTISDLEYSDEQYDESYTVEYNASSYKDAVKFLTKPNGDFHHDHFGILNSLREAKNEFIDFVIHKVAQKLERYGLRYESVQWFLHNYKSLNLGEISIKSWGKHNFPLPYYGYGEITSLKELRENFWQYCNDLKQEISYYAALHAKNIGIKKAKQKRILDEKITEYYKLGGSSFVEFTDHENNLGERVGFTRYDLINKIVDGYKVTCWSSSWLGLGNCNCINHEPGYSFEYGLTLQDIEMLIRHQKELNEYKEQLTQLPKGRWVLDYYENWSGKKYPDRELIIDESGCYITGINCYNSQDYGGTCRCVSHKTDYKKTISIDEAKELIKNYLQENK